MGIQPLKESLPDGVQFIRYQPKRGNTIGIHPWIIETETKVIRGEACAEKALILRKEGFFPNLICAHAGWAGLAGGMLLGTVECFVRSFGGKVGIYLM